MTIVYDMATGNIQSEQEQADSSTDRGAAVPEIGLQLVQEIECGNTQDAASIHVIRALLNRD
ncbi:MAG: hypothetical protein HKM88_04025 [Halobacteria archaeon]|nr:hypothetical protein [Halobacteria archaeon]